MGEPPETSPGLAPGSQLTVDAAAAPPETQRVRARQRLWARVQRSAARLEHAMDHARGQLRKRFGHAGALSILAYRGYATSEVVNVFGRLVEATVTTAPTPLDTRWQNVRRVVRWFNTREVAGAEIEARVAGVAQSLGTDDEGFFRAAIPRGAALASGPWQDVQLALVRCPLPGWAPQTVRAEVLVPPPEASFGIISDIDDTVLQTHVTDRLRMLWVTLSRNAHTRLPFPGTTELYRALAAGPSGRAENPVFYVSKSPWNLYEFLIEFLDKQGLPRGPLFLRDVGLHAEAPLDFKQAAIDELFTAYPRLPFILIGDSGERDPDIYVDAATRHPGRVRAIYIREVASSPARRRQLGALAERARRLGAELLYVSHAREALGHARRRGLVAPEG